MLNKEIVLLLVCCALIDAKYPLRKNLRFSVNEIQPEEDAENSVKVFEKNYNDEKIQKIQHTELGNLESEFGKLASLRQNQNEAEDSNVQTLDGFLAKVFSKQQTMNQDQDNLIKQKIEQDVKYLKEKQLSDPEVGFGGNPQSGPRILFANVTMQVNKIVNQAQRRLIQNGPKIYANNPPYVIYKIPRTPITFKLKSIEGASTITPQGTTMALHYFKALYTYAQFKFQEIRFNYDVIIKPLNFFTILKSITVVLENARVYMPVAVEDNVMIVQRFEFVLPDVTVEGAQNRFVNYLLNDIFIDKYYPDSKKRLADIAARDIKLLLDANVENAQ